MKVLILSQYYWPEPIPKPEELAQALAAAGDEVTVITGLPDYPSGNLYKGYRIRFLQQEQVKGIRVYRAFEFPYHGTHVLGRVANYLSFMVTAPLVSLFVPRFDVIYVWHPPLTVGIAAWLIARMRGVRFVYDVQDIWPEAAVLSGLLQPGIIVRTLSRLERFVYRRAAHLIVVTEGARLNLLGKGVPVDRVTALPHWFDSSFSVDNLAAARVKIRDAYGWSDRFVVMFAGNLGLVQGLETVVAAAERLASSSNACFAIVGDGSDKARLVALVEARGLQARVTFVDRQPMSCMPDFMAAADALLVHLRDSELSHWVIPTKTLAYLASGKPIIMAMRGAAADLVSQAGAGRILPPEDPDALVAAVQELAQLDAREREDMGGRGRAFLDKHLSKRHVIPRYRAMLEHHAHR